MKRIIFALLLLATICAARSQTQVLNVYLKDSIKSYRLSDIDSIVHNDNKTITIFNTYQSNSYNITLIDSLSLFANQYYQIADGSLEDFDSGVMDNNGCFMVCRQEEDGLFVYVGQKEKRMDGITLKFDENMNIQIVYSSKGMFYTIKDENTQTRYGVYILNDSIYIKELEDVAHQLKKSTRAAILNYDALKIVCRWINNAMTADDFATLLSNGNEYLPSFLIGLIPSIIGIPAYAELGLGLGLMYLQNRYEEGYSNLLVDYMGAPMIWISDIEEVNAPNYKIEVTVDGLDTSGKPLSCSLHTGIAMRINESNVTYENADAHLNEHGINADEVYNTSLAADKDTYYYLRPYVIVMDDGIGGQFPHPRPKYLWGGPDVPIISYGDVDKILYNPQPSATTGEYSNVEMNSATVECTFSNVPEGGQCGVEYSWNGGTSKQPMGSSDGTRNTTLSGLSPSTTYTYCAYVEVDGSIYYAKESKPFTTKAKELPDLTGTWTFTQTYLGAHTVYMDLELESSGSNWASYKASGFYGVITFHCTVSANGSASLSLNALDGACGLFSGTFDEGFTSVSGNSYTYVPSSSNWAVSPWTVNDSWSFHR